MGKRGRRASQSVHSCQHADPLATPTPPRCGDRLPKATFCRSKTHGKRQQKRLPTVSTWIWGVTMPTLPSSALVNEAESSCAAGGMVTGLLRSSWGTTGLLCDGRIRNRRQTKAVHFQAPWHATYCIFFNGNYKQCAAWLVERCVTENCARCACPQCLGAMAAHTLACWEEGAKIGRQGGWRSV